MLLNKVSKNNHEAETGSKYALSVRKDLRSIPKRFYCHWNCPGDIIQYDEKNKEIVDDIENGTCCFNHRVRLPNRKWETDINKVEVIPVELTHFNHRMMRNYFRHRKYSQNKCRGNGTSEILSIRWMIFKYGVLTTVRNRKCIIMPGTSSKLSTEFSTRIKEICDRIPQIYKHGIPLSDAPQKFHFKTGGRIELTSATPDADRGYENVGDIDQEEVAHWELVDDNPVYYASEGVYDKTRCHILHNTTPRGKRGFYYNLVWSPEANSDFYLHITNWREVVGVPVETVEELYPLGNITDETITTLRKECRHRYKVDKHYHDWYNSFFMDHDEPIPIEELMDVPIPILDINAIVSDSKTHRSHYDQELDNQFISGENRAIGEFMEENIPNPNLSEILRQYKEQAKFH